MLTLFLWPLIPFIGLLTYKRILIPYTYPYALDILTDVLLLVVMFACSIKRQSRALQIIQTVLALYILIFNCVDISVFLAIDNRLTLDNFLGNYQYVSVIPQFISAPIIIVFVSVILLILLLRKVKITLPLDPGSANFVVYILLFIGCIGYAMLTDELINTDLGHAYYLNSNSLTVNDVTNKSIGIVQKDFPELDKLAQELFIGANWKNGPKPNVDRPNIIINLSESLSAVDSQYSGGLYNRMPKIDAMMKDGLVLKSMHSNGGITAQGLAAMLLGIQTTKTQGVSEMMKYFRPDVFPENNIIAFAKAAGYHTIAICAGNPANWEGFSDWFRAVGFDEVYDRDSVIFASYPRYTWAAPDDEAMYTEALKLIAKQKGPYLLLIETETGHLPYILPQPEKYAISSDLLVNIIHYVDDTSYVFYQNLQKIGFFNNGVMIITGDHRRFQPIGTDEIRDGGFVVWGERTVGGIVGKGIPPNSSSDIPFTLRDMNTLLHYIVNGETVDENALMRSNLSAQLGINTPLAITVTLQSDNGSYLVRSAKYAPMMISIFDNVPFNQIPNQPYSDATAYLILNNQMVNQRLNTE